MKSKTIDLDDAPEIQGLRFRTFAGEDDFPGMYKIVEKAAIVDKEDHVATLEDIRHDYEHLSRSNPETDMIFAEIDGESVAYSRVGWYQEDDPNHRIYYHFVNIMPEWRYKGLETAMMKWCESRLLEVAADHPRDSKRFFQTYSDEEMSELNALLEALGYQRARYDFRMSRTLDDIPEAALPEGIEVRPVRMEDTFKIWQASMEAFLDHWGSTKPDKDEYESYRTSKYFQPDLWQVAWDGDEVVSSVMNYINHDYNAQANKSCGWTENISTRREWRRRGIARALIVRSMHMHKALGMTEVALGVDTENPNGALQLYQSLGYQTDRTRVTFRKEIK
jgi:mycothiol synthase